MPNKGGNQGSTQLAKLQAVILALDALTANDPSAYFYKLLDHHLRVVPFGVKELSESVPHRYTKHQSKHTHAAVYTCGYSSMATHTRLCFVPQTNYFGNEIPSQFCFPVDIWGACLGVHRIKTPTATGQVVSHHVGTTGSLLAHCLLPIRSLGRVFSWN